MPETVDIRRPEFDAILDNLRTALDTSLRLDIPETDADNFRRMHDVRSSLHIAVESLQSWERYRRRDVL